MLRACLLASLFLPSSLLSLLSCVQPYGHRLLCLRGLSCRSLLPSLHCTLHPTRGPPGCLAKDLQRGHLVTITTQAEQDFVAALAKNYGSRFWIDGVKNGNDGFASCTAPRLAPASLTQTGNPISPVREAMRTASSSFSQCCGTTCTAAMTAASLSSTRPASSPGALVCRALRVVFCLLFFCLAFHLCYYSCQLADIPVIPSFDSYN